MKSSGLLATELNIPRAGITTGIPELDRLIGGYAVGSSVLLAGPPGAYQRLLVQQFTVEAAAAGYHAVLVLSGEHPESIKQQMRTRGWILNSDHVKTRLHFVDWFSPMASGQTPTLLDASITVAQTIGHIREQSQLPIAVAGDSATQLIQRYGFDQVLRSAQTWKARAWVDGLVLLTTLTREAHTPTEVAALEANATLVLDIRQGDKGELFLRTVYPSRPQPDLQMRSSTLDVEGLRLSLTDEARLGTP